MDQNPKLTRKQQRFVEQYLVDYNSTQAAIRAGYEGDYPAQMGSHFLRQPAVKQAIDAALEKQKFNFVALIEQLKVALIQFMTDGQSIANVVTQSAQLLWELNHCLPQSGPGSNDTGHFAAIVPHDCDLITDKHVVHMQTYCKFKCDLVDKCCSRDDLDQEIGRMKKECNEQCGERKNPPH